MRRYHTYNCLWSMEKLSLLSQVQENLCIYTTRAIDVSSQKGHIKSVYKFHSVADCFIIDFPKSNYCRGFILKVKLHIFFICAKEAQKCFNRGKVYSTFLSSLHLQQKMCTWCDWYRYHSRKRVSFISLASAKFVFKFEKNRIPGICGIFTCTCSIWISSSIYLDHSRNIMSLFRSIRVYTTSYQKNQRPFCRWWLCARVEVWSMKRVLRFFLWGIYSQFWARLQLLVRCLRKCRCLFKTFSLFLI